MSAKPRRGHAAPVSHKKPTPAPAPARRPASTAAPVKSEDDELEREALAAAPAKSPARRPAARPVKRERGLTRFIHSRALRSFGGYVGVYIPLFVIMVCLLGTLFVYKTYINPSYTPAQTWVRIENKWLMNRERDRDELNDALSDFEKQKTAYGHFRDDTKGWMDDLSAVSDWTDPDRTAYENEQVAQAVSSFITAGRIQIQTLNIAASAKTSDDIAAIGDTISSDDETFSTDYQLARLAILGDAALPSISPTPESTLAIPTLAPTPCATAAPTAVPASGSPGLSPSPSVAPSAGTSPASSASPGASLPLCATPAPTQGASDSAGP